MLRNVEMENRQPKWAMEEAAFLLVGYFAYKSKHFTKTEVISKVSCVLRAYAESIGLNIDKAYRNEVGIAFQLAAMDSAYQGKTVFKPASVLFKEEVALYQSDKGAFYKILRNIKNALVKCQRPEIALFYELEDIAILNKVDDLKNCEGFSQDIDDAMKRKHPLAYPRVKEALRNYAKPDGNGMSVSRLQIEIGDNYSQDEIKELLDNCSWSEYDSTRSLYKYYNNESASLGLVSDGVVASSTNSRSKRQEVEDSAESVAFLEWLTDDAGLAPITARGYVSAVHCIERLLEEENFSSSELFGRSAEEVISVTRLLMENKRFQDANETQHNRLRSGLSQYIKYLGGESPFKRTRSSSTERVTKNSIRVAIDDSAESRAFYDWMINEKGMSKSTVRSYVSAIHNVEGLLDQEGSYVTKIFGSDLEVVIDTCNYLSKNQTYNDANVSQHNRLRGALLKYVEFLGGDPQKISKGYNKTHGLIIEQPQLEETINLKKDDRWQPILVDAFPDGYILNDFLSQFQASAFWNERYGEACPVEGMMIDANMKALGSVRDGRVYPICDGDNELMKEICSVIEEALDKFSCVYRGCIYERYQSRLADHAIYSEQVMSQQLLSAAKGDFYSSYQCFVRQGKEMSVIQDCRTVLRNHGGAMAVEDVAKELWFVPYDIVYHKLSVDTEAINIGASRWMLVEHFPLTRAEADKVGDIFDECFISQNYIQQSEIMPLLEKNLPSIAENLSGLPFNAVFNVLNYYLKERFSFSKALVAPKGSKTDFRDLFKLFASEHEKFTLEELTAYANDLNIPIYWESIFDGGAIRISEKEFVHRNFISFNVDATDEVLESICTGDYLPLQSVTSAMMVHLPPCGYSWNGYLLLSYIYCFSKVFWLSYNSIGKTGCYGAMVRRNCTEIASYDLLVEHVLTDSSNWHNESDALVLLVEKGYQARQRLNGIEQIVAKVRQNKMIDER